MRRGMSLILAVLLGTSTDMSGQTRPPSSPQPTATAAAAVPKVMRIALPPLPGAVAIWGATGQDSRGHIWLGVATTRIPVPSAHLLEHDPMSGTTTDRGNVVEELQRLGLLRPGEHQAKIHSKIVQGPDGCLYFASMDEEGENENGSHLPTWGGHLWRLRLATGRWEHLGATAEALIAVAGGDRFIYALGYFGHVLYQYDTKSGQMRRLQVGSVDGHISRNFFSDSRGHVYVPRLRAEPAAAGRLLKVSLVEIGTDLRELNETPIETDRYLEGNDATGSHGIVALQPMADGSIFFTTHRGYLYRMAPPAPVRGSTSQAAAAVTAIGWLYLDGPTYAASLFTPDGTRTLYSLARTSAGYQWLTCAVGVAPQPCRSAPFVVPAIEATALGSTAFYGSATRDAQGGYYVVGSTPFRGGPTFEPILLRVEP
jgi:hypothetical protein